MINNFIVVAYFSYCFVWLKICCFGSPSNRLFIPKNGACEFSHTAHEKLELNQVVRGIGDLADNTLEVISNLLENHCAASMTQQFLELTTGGRLPPNSMAKLRQCVLMRKFKSTSSETTAEILLRLLEEDEEMSCVTCTGSFDEATDLVKIRKKRRKSDKTEDVTSTVVHDSEAKSCIKSVTLGLSLGGGEFLLAIMWVSKTGRHFHRLHPKLFGVDVKFRVNQEERPLFRSCGRNTSGKNLPGINGFLPSQQL